jgi:hypothetical protein
MSSLQKFHRRTNSAVPPAPIFPTLGSGNTTRGYWVATISGNKIISGSYNMGSTLWWGSQGTTRGGTNRDDGLANTNRLVSFGAGAHPAAEFCKNLTTGGYNTWYLPAYNEMASIISNQSSFPGLVGYNGTPFWTSTEYAFNTAYVLTMTSGGYSFYDYDKNQGKRALPIRRTTVI